MREVDVDPLTYEIGQHVVEINKLVNELNRVARQGHKPNYALMDDLATAIKSETTMIQWICDKRRDV